MRIDTQGKRVTRLRFCICISNEGWDTLRWRKAWIVDLGVILECCTSQCRPKKTDFSFLSNNTYSLSDIPIFSSKSGQRLGRQSGHPMEYTHKRAEYRAPLDCIWPNHENQLKNYGLETVQGTRFMYDEIRSHCKSLFYSTMRSEINR